MLVDIDDVVGVVDTKAGKKERKKSCQSAAAFPGQGLRGCVTFDGHLSSFGQDTFSWDWDTYGSIDFS